MGQLDGERTMAINILIIVVCLLWMIIKFGR